MEYVIYALVILAFIGTGVLFGVFLHYSMSGSGKE